MSEVRLDTEDTGPISITPPLIGGPVQETRTLALRLLLGMRASTKFLDRTYLVMGWICGLELLLLGFFVTYQVLARKWGWVQAPATTTMSGYVLAMAATWSFSYALRTGSHVRIDVMLPFMGVKTRRLADLAAVGSIGFIATITAWKLWVTIIRDYNIHKITLDYPLTPVWIPKLVVGLGFSFLAFAAIHMMLCMMAEWFLPIWHKKMGGGDIESYDLMGSGGPSSIA